MRLMESIPFLYHLWACGKDSLQTKVFVFVYFLFDCMMTSAPKEKVRMKNCEPKETGFHFQISLIMIQPLSISEDLKFEKKKSCSIENVTFPT